MSVKLFDPFLWEGRVGAYLDGSISDCILLVGFIGGDLEIVSN